MLQTSAAHALLKTDGLVIDDKTLSVAVSNPPERKNNTSLIPSISEIALGGGSGDKSDFGQYVVASISPLWVQSMGN